MPLLKLVAAILTANLLSFLFIYCMLKMDRVERLFGEDGVSPWLYVGAIVPLIFIVSGFYLYG